MQPENETPEPLGNIEQSEVKNAPGNKFKSAETGKYVTDEFAAANPRTTYAVTKEGRASVDIAAFVESGITESTLELLLNDIRRSSAEYSGKAQLIRAIEKQIERARN